MKKTQTQEQYCVIMSTTINASSAQEAEKKAVEALRYFDAQTTACRGCIGSAVDSVQSMTDGEIDYKEGIEN